MPWWAWFAVGFVLGLPVGVVLLARLVGPVLGILMKGYDKP